MKIAIWTHHPGDLLGEAIDFLTHGSAQHAGFIRQSGLIVEAYWPKVRQRPVLDAERPFLRVFELRGMSAEQHDAFEAWFDRLLAAPPEYSGVDLFRFLFNRPDTDEKHTYCSRLVMHGCMDLLPPILWPLTRCMEGDWVSPRDLFISNQLVTSAI